MKWKKERIYFETVWVGENGFQITETKFKEFRLSKDGETIIISVTLKGAKEAAEIHNAKLKGEENG